MANYSALHYSEKARKYAEEAQRIRETLSGIYTFKGSVDTFNDLPSNAEVGSVYDVREDNANYAWTGDQWDSLGSVLDLSGYATKSEIPTTANQVSALPNTTKYGSGLSYTDNTLKLLDQDGNALGSSIEIKASGSGLDGKITNCITYIPQDIKLELNNGTLTLKAGSKVYVPNGVNAFNARVFTQDLSISSLGADTGTFLLIYGQSAWASQETFDYFNADQTNLFSGSSQPTTSADNTLWYDTTNNVIKTTNNRGSTWAITNNTFPICIVTASSGKIISIDQVFNGFGYIGSTVFALPGVKLLIPNDRNEDGTLKSIEVEFDTVKTGTLSFGAQDYYLCISKNKKFVFASKKITEYHESKNLLYDVYAGSYVQWGIVGSIRGDANNKLSNFQPKTTFHAVDYNDAVKYSDKAEVVGWGMPDYSRSFTISSGYTTTTDGYFEGVCASTGSYKITIGGVVMVDRGYSNTGVGFPFAIAVPKGTNITFTSIQIPKFIPCKGV